MPGEYLFVYGKLRRGCRNEYAALLHRHSDFIDKAFMQGRLYRVADYPGAVETADKAELVTGELYFAHEPGKLLGKLDYFEACSREFQKPHEYIRKLTEIKRPGGETITAWVYIYNRDVSHLKYIPGGIYPFY